MSHLSSYLGLVYNTMMSLNLKPISIYLLGKQPPPVGGVTIFAERLYFFLKEDPAFWVSFYELKRNNKALLNSKPLSIIWMLKLLFFGFHKKIIVHYLGCSTLGFVFLALLKMRIRKNIVTIGMIHGYRSQLLIYPFIKNYKKEAPLLIELSKFLLGFCEFVICNEQKMTNRYNDYIGGLSSVRYIPFFIIPIQERLLKKGEINQLSKFKRCFLHNIIVSIWAVRFNDDIDLYGIDLVIQSFSMLKHSHPDLNVGLVVHVCQCTKDDILYLNALKLENKLCDEDILFIFNQDIPSYNLMGENDIFVRATYTDGTAISIYEVAYYQPKAIILASDCAKRLDGVIMFKNRDASDLADKLDHILNQPKRCQNVFNKQDINQYGDAFKTLYREAYGKV